MKWNDPKNECYTYYNLIKQYVNYMNKSYGNNYIVVFDGYVEEFKNTKNNEHLRRLEKNYCPDIDFTDATTVVVPQQKCLSNSKNKQKLIEMIKTDLHNQDTQCSIAQEDADADINTAIDAAKNYANESIIIVGEDIDLFILLTQLG